jgi:hypothetical protein
MPTDLTDSPVDRQNILNNPFAIAEIEKATQLSGVLFEGRTRVVKEQIAAFYEVAPRTIERCLEQNARELSQNGYEVIRGKRLQDFRLAVANQVGTDIGVGTKTTVLGVFDFRAFLNIGMLLTDSNRARLLRQMVLDIVLDVINQRTGGGTKYINQRDEQFLHAWFKGETYRKKFTDALRDCVRMGNFKYAVYTDKVYESVFKEKSKKYRQILKLNAADKTRDTFYTEVLDLIAAIENGLADVLRKKFAEKGRMLESMEVDAVMGKLETDPFLSPLIDSARNKMASRDLAFRDSLHQRLTEYITPIEAAEFGRFLGEKSQELQERLEEAKDVFKRLKDRE